MRNLYLPNIGSDYYVAIARELIKFDFRIKVVGFGKEGLKRSNSLKEFLKEFNPKVSKWEDNAIIENFDKIFDPDYSKFSNKFFIEMHYFEKIFIMSLDRNLFEPISQIEKIRLFHRYFAHAYKLIKKEKIDSILFFGTPHGGWSIALCAVAEVLNIDLRYTDFGLFPELSTIETNINIRKKYSRNEILLGKKINPKKSIQIKEIIEKRVNLPLVWSYKPPNNFNRIKKVIKRIFGLIFLSPLKNYYSAEFSYNRISRKGFTIVFKYIKYLIEITKSSNFYNRNSINKLPEKNSIVIFLHMQPEASTVPMGYIFADQILMIEIILNSAPKDLNIYIKEHPHMYTSPAQDRHDRSVYFYKRLLRDKRVKFLNKNINSNQIINKAKYICSTCGSVSWEALKLGKPCIIFGWAWFSDCKSAYSVDSAESFLKAIKQIRNTNKNNVDSNVKEFIERLKKRLIYGVAYDRALSYVGKDYQYNDGIKNISKAINYSFNKKYKTKD